MSAITTKGTALVTGVSAGIGAIYADQLAKRGYNRILVASDKTRLAGLAQHRGGIRFHIANLWRLLGDGKNGARTSRRHRSAATALWRRFLRGEQRQPARMNFSKIACMRFVTIVGSIGVRQRWRSQSEASGEAKVFSFSVAKERSDDQHAQRD